jgi:hypothetical protein
VGVAVATTVGVGVCVGVSVGVSDRVGVGVTVFVEVGVGRRFRQLIDLGDSCVPLTTDRVSAILNNASGSAGTTIPSGGPFSENGMPIACSALSAGNLAGLRLAGATIFYGSTIGDLVAGLLFNCE